MDEILVYKKDVVEADDGGLANVVGCWAEEKHKRLCNYVGIASAVRRKFLNGPSGAATYIDLYSAMGRSQIRDTSRFIPGSSLAAWNESVSSGTPFSEVIIADLDPDAVEQCSTRLEKAGAPVKMFTGAAQDTVDEICDNLDPYGYHFTFLDPYNLQALPFKVIQRLTQVKRMDLLIHVSAMDLQRNFARFKSGEQPGLDTFAPGWKQIIPFDRSETVQRQMIFEYWRKQIGDSGKTTANGIELVTGEKNQPLYWLVFASGHPKAEEFWEKVRRVDGQQNLF